MTAIPTAFEGNPGALALGGDYGDVIDSQIRRNRFQKQLCFVSERTARRGRSSSDDLREGHVAGIDGYSDGITGVVVAVIYRATVTEIAATSVARRNMPDSSGPARVCLT